MREKNKLAIDEILASMDGAARAHPPGNLFSKVEQRITQAFPVVKTVPFRVVSLAAASILLLFIANVLIAAKASERNMPARGADGVQQVAEYYGFTDNFGL